MNTELKDLNRGELNDFASEHHADVIADPEAYPNINDLREAVEAAQAGDPVPAPKAKSGGTTVKLTAAPEGFRSAQVNGQRFVIETPVESVSSETVEAIKQFAEETPGFEFEIN